jgi:hypothetical protein
MPEAKGNSRERYAYCSLRFDNSTAGQIISAGRGQITVGTPETSSPIDVGSVMATAAKLATVAGRNERIRRLASI